MPTYKLYETYGFKDGDIEEIAADVADALQIEFKRHESIAYHGAYFRFFSEQTGASDYLGLVLMHNQHPFDPVQVCDFAPDCRYVLTVSQDGGESRVEAGLASMTRNRPELLERVLFDRDRPLFSEDQFRRGETP